MAPLYTHSPTIPPATMASAILTTTSIIHSLRRSPTPHFLGSHSSLSLLTSCTPRSTRGSRGCGPAYVLPVPREETETEGEEQEDMENYTVLTAIKSEYNEIVVLDTPKSRVLLLDSTHNVHSILYKKRRLTGSYWDDFSTLPAIVPNGPIAILGLGAGTAAHIMLDLWPSLQLEGWEIDGILVDKAREYFRLSDLENQTNAGGFLSINIGDALISVANHREKFAGIVVDLFSGGKILPQLEQPSTWFELESSLMPNGRIMVNCAGVRTENPRIDDELVDSKNCGGSWTMNSCVKALNQVFPKMLSWKRIDEKYSENYLALTGPVPDLDTWSAAVPQQLSSIVKQWKPCEFV